LFKAVVLAVAVAASLAMYFSLSLYALPQSYESAFLPRKPEAVLTNVSLSALEITLGKTFTMSVTGANRGDDADMQIVSLGFPNLTRIGNNVLVLKHNFKQTPIQADTGKAVGSEYVGREKEIRARYAAIEAFSRPWEGGVTFTIDVQVEPQNEGKFVVFVKSIALPHTWERAHWPPQGISDYQQELVQPYTIQVTKP
jgi:hypothetical protein